MGFWKRLFERVFGESSGSGYVGGTSYGGDVPTSTGPTRSTDECKHEKCYDAEGHRIAQVCDDCGEQLDGLMNC